jgi:hypothetical protein
MKQYQLQKRGIARDVYSMYKKVMACDLYSMYQCTIYIVILRMWKAVTWNKRYALDIHTDLTLCLTLSHSIYTPICTDMYSIDTLIQYVLYTDVYSTYTLISHSLTVSLSLYSCVRARTKVSTILRRFVCICAGSSASGPITLLQVRRATDTLLLSKPLCCQLISLLQVSSATYTLNPKP